MSQKTDTIDVRPEEALDQNNLEKFLYGKLEGSEQPLIVRQFPGGKANLTYLLKYGNDEYVLRRPPLGPVAPGAHDMSREFDVLSVLQKAFPLAPKAYLYENDPAIVGAPFFIMERRNGLVIRSSMPEEFSKIDEAGKQISEALVDALADLHKVNYSELGLENFGKPDGFIERQINGWYSRWTKAKHQDSVEIESIYNWLVSNMPKSNNTSLVHNDYKLDNAMYSFNEPNKLEAIFDWDMCTLGDPLSDLGSLLCYWTDPEDPPFFGESTITPKDESLLTRKELIYRYTQKSGLDTSHIVFYHVLGLFRLIGIIAQIYIRYVRRQTSDKRFANLGEAIPLLAKFALQTSENKI
jgi:aminoglycoside phosphotransferase (APT) family kinase protein